MDFQDSLSKVHILGLLRLNLLVHDFPLNAHYYHIEEMEELYNFLFQLLYYAMFFFVAVEI